MANRSKAKGTSAESAIVAYLRANGFPWAERRALAGIADKGDVGGIPGVVVEAKDCVRVELAKWLDEATVEKANAGAQVGFVWFKRRGTTDPGKWFVLMSGEQVVELIR